MLEDRNARHALATMLVPVFGLALLTAGCNTVRGMGEDVSAAGSGMSSAAEATEEKMEEQLQEKESDKDLEGDLK